MTGSDGCGTITNQSELKSPKEHEEFERLLSIHGVKRPAQKLVDFIGHVGLRLLRQIQVG